MYLVERNSALLARGQASDCLMAVGVSRTPNNEGQQPLQSGRPQLRYRRAAADSCIDEVSPRAWLVPTDAEKSNGPAKRP
jgi:hypothetical protein